MAANLCDLLVHLYSLCGISLYALNFLGHFVFILASLSSIVSFDPKVIFPPPLKL